MPTKVAFFVYEFILNFVGLMSVKYTHRLRRFSDKSDS